MNNYARPGLRLWLQGVAFVVILCACAGLVSCNHDADRKSIDLGDSFLKAAYED